MVTVITSTTNRPQLLRAALCSIQRQTAREQITSVVVSENAGGRETRRLCAEFPDLPINFIFRDPPLRPLDHGRALYTHPDQIPSPYVAILHDDDWWAPHHIEDGLKALAASADAVAYWGTSFLVHGESSWFMQCWNESCWVVAGFPPTTEVVKLDKKQAALACVGSGPAHYSSLIAKKDILAEAFEAVYHTGNLHDNDRLLFLELSRRGPLLVNFVPDVFVRQHPAQDQRQLSSQDSYEHVAAATRIVLDYCKELQLDPGAEFERLYEKCPVETYRPYILGTFDPRVITYLKRRNELPLPQLFRRPAPLWLAYQVCPPALWAAARRMKRAIRPGQPAHA